MTGRMTASGRVIAVIVLLAAGAAGLGAAGPLLSAPGSTAAVATGGRVAFLLITFLEAIGLAAAAAMAVSLFRRRRRRDDDLREHVYEEPPLPWWARPAAILLALALLAAPPILLITLSHRHGQAVRPPGIVPPLSVAPRTGAGSHAAGAGTGDWPVTGGLAAAAVAILAVIAVLAWQRRPRARAAAEDRAHRPASPLADALAAGSRALRTDGDPRTAIVRCYAAMEHSLTEAGVPPAAGDTPAEILARARAAGLARTPAATTLTGLFREARYSEHPLTEADRAAAVTALDQLRAEAGGQP